MLIQSNIKVIRNELIAKDTYKLVFDYQLKAKPGQFINIKLDHHFLRRPLSISKINENDFEVIYKVKGEGTKDLTEVKPEEDLDVLFPLGNGFDLVENKKVLLVGGGIGVPPLLELYTQLKSHNEVKLIIGLNTVSENAYAKYNPRVCTLDQTGDFCGNVIEYIKQSQLEYDYVYACGPMGMLHQINQMDVDGQISIEERMGCGFGACMGCSCQTTSHTYKRICVDGPVFKIGELNLNEY